MDNQGFQALANAQYQKGLSPASNQLRELGLIERSSGLAAGLRDLQMKLNDFRDRLDGNGGPKGVGNDTGACGLSGHLSEAETTLRACHMLLDELASKF